MVNDGEKKIWRKENIFSLVFKMTNHEEKWRSQLQQPDADVPREGDNIPPPSEPCSVFIVRNNLFSPGYSRYKNILLQFRLKPLKKYSEVAHRNHNHVAIDEDPHHPSVEYINWFESIFLQNFSHFNGFDAEMLVAGPGARSSSKKLMMLKKNDSCDPLQVW